jgi:hypothetical protein
MKAAKGSEAEVETMPGKRRKEGLDGGLPITEGIVTAVSTTKKRSTAGATVQSSAEPGESDECAPRVCDGTPAYAVANSGGSTAKVGPTKAKGKPSAEAVGLCEDPELGATGSA